MSVFLLSELLLVYVLLPVLAITELLIPLINNKPLFPVITYLKRRSK